MDSGHDATRDAGSDRERDRRPAHESSKDRDGKSPARSAQRERSGSDPTGKNREPDRGSGSGRRDKVAGESELEKAAGAKQKSRDFDLGM